MRSPANPRRIFLIGVLAGALLGLFVAAPFDGTAPLSPVRASEDDGPMEPSRDERYETARQLSSLFEYVAEEIRPSVVSVLSVRRVPATAVPSPFGGAPSEEPLERFFGRDFLDRFFGERVPDRFSAPEGRGERRQQGLGSGLIVSEEGYVLTNNHVVDQADSVSVQLPGGKKYRAELVGADPLTDLAVLDIEAEELTPARLGDSDDLKIGEWVVAAGNPFGLSSTITAGIVSATGRANVGIADYEDFIQTDAAINPGNSGGPLVNLQGEVVGLNTAIFSRTGGNSGIGFAIPIQMARSVMRSLIEHGRVVRGWLGVVIQNLDAGLARSFGYSSTDGALIAEVRAGTPADEAGLRAGDIVVRYDDRPVTSMEQLRSAVAATAPGRSVEIEIVREGERETVEVTLEERDPSVAANSPERRERPSVASLGMKVETLDAATARRLGIEGERGVVVTQVDPLGPAASVGMRPGDLVVSLQGTPTPDLETFRKTLDEQGDAEGVRIVVVREGMRLFVYLPLSG